MSSKRVIARLSAGLFGVVLIGTVAVGTTSAVEPVTGGNDRSRAEDLLAKVEAAGGIQALSDMPGAEDPVLHNVAPGTLGAASSFYVEDPDTGEVFFIGEVWNRTNTRRQFVELTIRLRNASNTIIGAGYGYVFEYNVAPGGRAFMIGFAAAPPAGWTTYEIVHAFSESVSTPIAGPLAPKYGVPFDDGEGRHYPIEVRNINNSTIDEVISIMFQYDSAGRLIDFWFGGIDTSVPPGDSILYEILVPEQVPGMVRYSITTEAIRAGSDPTHDQTYYSWNNYFDDIGNSPFRTDILWNAEAGITTGCGPGRFCPVANVPRDQMASFLSRALGLTAAAPDAFTDDNGNLHEANINRVAAEGIASGCGGTNYCPSANVARDQMASFLARARELTGTPADAFTDDTGNIHELNINRVAAAGIATGCAAGKYCPSAFVTREQMAAFLRRAFE
jgi:hypothetical protein